jgi:hypothetical protein
MIGVTTRRKLSLDLLRIDGLPHKIQPVFGYVFESIQFKLETHQYHGGILLAQRAMLFQFKAPKSHNGSEETDHKFASSISQTK